MFYLYIITILLYCIHARAGDINTLLAVNKPIHIGTVWFKSDSDYNDTDYHWAIDERDGDFGKLYYKEFALVLIGSDQKVYSYQLGGSYIDKYSPSILTKTSGADYGDGFDWVISEDFGHYDSLGDVSWLCSDGTLHEIYGRFFRRNYQDLTEVIYDGTNIFNVTKFDGEEYWQTGEMTFTETGSWNIPDLDSIIYDLLPMGNLSARYDLTLKISWTIAENLETSQLYLYVLAGFIEECYLEGTEYDSCSYLGQDYFDSLISKEYYAIPDSLTAVRLVVFATNEITGNSDLISFDADSGVVEKLFDISFETVQEHLYLKEDCSGGLAEADTITNNIISINEPDLSSSSITIYLEDNWVDVVSDIAYGVSLPSIDIDIESDYTAIEGVTCSTGTSGIYVESNLLFTTDGTKVMIESVNTDYISATAVYLVIEGIDCTETYIEDLNEICDCTGVIGCDFETETDDEGEELFTTEAPSVADNLRRRKRSLWDSITGWDVWEKAACSITITPIVGIGIGVDQFIDACDKGTASKRSVEKMIENSRQTLETLIEENYNDNVIAIGTIDDKISNISGSLKIYLTQQNEIESNIETAISAWAETAVQVYNNTMMLNDLADYIDQLTVALTVDMEGYVSIISINLSFQNLLILANSIGYDEGFVLEDVIGYSQNNLGAFQMQSNLIRVRNSVTQVTIMAMNEFLYGVSEALDTVGTIMSGSLYIQNKTVQYLSDENTDNTGLLLFMNYVIAENDQSILSLIGSGTVEDISILIRFAWGIVLFIVTILWLRSSSETIVPMAGKATGIEDKSGGKVGFKAMRTDGYTRDFFMFLFMLIVSVEFMLDLIIKVITGFVMFHDFITFNWF